MLASGTCLPLILVGFAFASPVRDFISFGAFGALLILVLLGLGAVARTVAAIRRERLAGYTTLFGREHRSLWHLDPITGAVIRPPIELTDAPRDVRR